MAKKTKQAKWSVESTLAALAAVPAPLRTPADASVFDDAMHLLADAPDADAMEALTAPASAGLLRVVDATVGRRGAEKFADEILYALKMLVIIGEPDGIECTIRVAESGYAKDSYMWSAVMGIFAEGHPGASWVFGALSRPLPEGFMAVAMLDAATEACREHRFSPHPFDSAAGVARLKAYLTSKKLEDASYAFSACAAAPFLSERRRGSIIKLGLAHREPEVRMEAAWASAKIGQKVGVDRLVEACTDPTRSAKACRYLKELKKSKLIPKGVKDPVFAATAEMCEWLQHPSEFGESPSRISLLDSRKIWWPPTKDVRKVFLFRYEYDKSKHRPEKDVGVGMVGSVTFALFGDTSAEMTPEQLYGMHCEWELGLAEDARAPKNRTGKKGWSLIESRG